jgi:cobalamin biosynthesis protein CobD/CbiB
MTIQEILEMAKQTTWRYPSPQGESLIAFARLVQQAQREEDIAIARDFVQYISDWDKADECAAAIRKGCME